MEKTSQHKEFGTLHLIIAADYSFDRSSRVTITHGMKKYQLNSVCVTKLKLYREGLATKESEERYCKFPEAVLAGDDLEWLFDCLRCGKDKDDFLPFSEEHFPSETAYFYPKLNEKELKLVKDKDVIFLSTFENFTKKSQTVDVNEAQMKKSKSTSKYIRAKWSRRTYIISKGRHFL